MPVSPNMPAKQREMDGIVREIYHGMETHGHLQSSLLVLSGDHGMNEAGNHGGSSVGEVSTALVFVSPKLKSTFSGLESPLPESENFQFYEKIEQSDIAPTLAALLGFPVPRNNLGIIIPSFLELWAQGV
jgi:ethanolaminephosphotransferase